MKALASPASRNDHTEQPGGQAVGVECERHRRCHHSRHAVFGDGTTEGSSAAYRGSGLACGDQGLVWMLLPGTSPLGKTQKMRA